MDAFYKVDGHWLPAGFAKQCLEEGFVCIKGCFGYSLADACQMSLSRFVEKNWRLFQFDRDTVKEENARKAIAKAWEFCTLKPNKNIHVLFVMPNLDLYVCHLSGEYRYCKTDYWNHQRPVEWTGKVINGEDMSKQLREAFFNDYFNYGFVDDQFTPELMNLMEGKTPVTEPSKEETPKSEPSEDERNLFRTCVTERKWQILNPRKQFIEQHSTLPAAFSTIKDVINLYGDRSDGEKVCFIFEEYRYEYSLFESREGVFIYRYPVKAPTAPCRNPKTPPSQLEEYLGRLSALGNWQKAGDRGLLPTQEYVYRHNIGYDGIYQFKKIIEGIRKNGKLMTIEGKNYIFYRYGDYQYWTTNRPLSETNTINRVLDEELPKES